MYRFKIETEIDSQWNKYLLKNPSGNFFQSSNYLISDSENYFPLFIYIFDESDNVVAQLGLSIIKTTVLYSSSSFQNILKLISNLTRRGIWLFGPIIYSDISKERLEILQEIMVAIDVVCKKYDLVFMEGYTSPYEKFLNEEYTQLFSKNDCIVFDQVTYMSDLRRSLDEIWNDISKKTRGDVNRAERRGITAREVQTIDELKQFLLLHQTWAKTKGLEISDPFQDQEKLWNNHQLGLEKFFLAYMDDELISGLRLSCFNGIAYTHFVVSSYSKSTSLGGSLLTWFAIKWAKNAGLRLYDFSGGPKSKTQDSLFFYKKKWGGQEYFHYNIIKKQKKFHYILYRFLFGMVRSYHVFKSKYTKSMK